MASDQRQSLEAKLSQVELAISKLEQERIQLKRKINKCCPVSKLPAEILGEIFLDTFPRKSFSTWGQSSPLLFGAVCSSWRDVAWSFPTLWSSVSFTMENYTRAKNDVLREWVERSGKLPLSIMFNMRKPSENLKKRRRMIMAPIILESREIITCCSSRWQDIDFYLLTGFGPDFNFMPTDLPLLVSMSIIVRDTSLSYNRKFQPRSYNAPELQYVRHNIQGLDIPLKQIKTFSWASAAEPDDYLRIFKEAPNLIEVRFTDMSCMFTRPRSTGMITASQLKTLEATFISENNVPLELFNNLMIPAARELIVGITPYNWNFMRRLSTVFISLIFRSGCHLTRLSLSQLSLYADEFAEWFSVVPSLVELHMKNIKEIRRVFRDLTLYKASRRNFLPNLEKFTYVHCVDDEIDFGALADMATSRWGHDSRILPLQELEVAQLTTVCVKASGNSSQRSPGSTFYREIEDAEEKIEREEKYHSDNEMKIYVKTPREDIAKFQGLIAEGMDIRVPGMDYWRKYIVK